MKFVKKIMLFVFVLLILTGCGRDDDKIIMVTEAGFAPYEYYDNGEIVGVDVDIANEIAKKNAHVGTVRISGLKPFPKYQLEINITFEVGSSQEVKVNIQEELSGINKTEVLKLV